MYLKELNAQPEIKLRIVIFEGEVYDRFAKYKSKIQAASGEFLYDFDADEVPLAQEFIQPPYLLSKETLSTNITWFKGCLLYTSPSPRDRTRSRMPSSA